MPAQFTYASRRRTLAITWGSGRAKARRHATAGSVPDMPMSTTDRARLAAQAANAKPDPQRSEKRRKAAAAAHSLPSLARRVAAKWAGATDAERVEALDALREAGVPVTG